ncbi:type I restriction enzyme endonuclease domain-containing protein [Xanthobacter sp.]|uniref:type I restriction enzyme endonuclease domain-containing protein n=1 Tax=Xanthobacter sp. TaxID=35809 RepID=UPI0035AE39EE
MSARADLRSALAIARIPGRSGTPAYATPSGHRDRRAPSAPRPCDDRPACPWPASPEEIAFYDALAENESAVQVMGNNSLKVTAHELLVGLKGSASVDWSHRESARAKMRVLVKRVLRKHGYPPDLQDAAVQTVLRQAEALSASWA